MNPQKLTVICYTGTESIALACADLQSDLARIGNAKVAVKAASAFAPGSVTVGCAEDTAFASLWQEHDLPAATGWEQYVLVIREDRILICGADERGTLWGIYALSHLLGIPAGIRFSQTEIKPCTYLQNRTVFSPKPTYKYRGWFINDEDLLTCWRTRYVRELDYPFYQNIITIETLSYLVETALRMGFNLIIPATLLDIDDPRQEELVAYCVKRGMLVTQHHIEPLGVSHWYYDSYMKKQGRESVFSYVTNKDDAIEVWTHYAKKWAKYGSHVIWQLGLRGKADRPVWDNDNAKQSMTEWGQLISEAIQSQYDIVEGLVGRDFASTVTLWMEGATLFHEGYLRLPEKSTLVFADVGPTQMLSADFYDTPREASRTYGMYYHICYWGDGPHLAQGTSWRKMAYNYSLAVAKGDTEYSILNVSNVRFFIPSLEANARLTRDFEHFDAANAYAEIAKEYFGCGAIGKLMDEYFSALVSIDTQELVEKYKKFFSFHHGQYEDFSYYTATDGVLKWIGRDGLDKKVAPVWCERLKESMDKLQIILSRAMALPYAPYFEMMLYQIKHMICMENWVYNCCRYSMTDEKDFLKKAINALKTDLTLRPALEQGEWKDFFKGDKKIGISYLIQETELTQETGKRTELII